MVLLGVTNGGGGCDGTTTCIVVSFVSVARRDAAEDGALNDSFRTVPRADAGVRGDIADIADCGESASLRSMPYAAVWSIMRPRPTAPEGVIAGGEGAPDRRAE
jgi:hypothetical protein